MANYQEKPAVAQPESPGAETTVQWALALLEWCLKGLREYVCNESMPEGHWSAGIAWNASKDQIQIEGKIPAKVQLNRHEGPSQYRASHATFAQGTKVLMLAEEGVDCPKLDDELDRP